MFEQEESGLSAVEQERQRFLVSKQEKSNFSPPAVGGSSLLVVFAVLCLTVFALLGLSTVRADIRLGDASAQAVLEYYAADCAAQEVLAHLRAGEVPSGVAVSGNVYTYACPMSDTQALEVEVRLDGAEYTILRWQAVSVGEWKTDSSLYVWDGQAS